MSTTELKLVQGRLEQSKVCVIVNSTNQGLNLQVNASARSLAEAAGPQLQKACNKLKPLNKGQVKVSDGFKLKCKKVLHCWIGGIYEGRHSEKDLENAIMECLRVADKDLKCKSIAFPTLGTGVLQYPADVVARYFIRCMKKSTIENLTEIIVVIFHDDKSIYEKFSMVLAQHRQLNWSQSEHFMDSSNGKIVGDSLVALTLDSPEYIHVESNFTKSIQSPGVTIMEIIRIQNITQWKMYQEHARHTAKKYKITEKEVERTLWHCTTEEECSKMAHSFINRSIESENDYGKGAYFARDASYLDSRQNNSDEKIMLQVKVVVGKFALGKKEYIIPPKMPDGVQYDSVVNNEQNPSIFVVFEDTAAYPEYIIKYKKMTTSGKNTGQGLPNQSAQPTTPASSTTQSNNNSSCTIL